MPRLLTNLVSTPYNKFTTLQNKWRGREFKVPLNAAATTITNSIYSTGLKRFFPANRAFTNVFESGFAVPDWKLHITNRVQYFLIDLDLNRVVDAVNLDNLVTSMDITQLTTGQTGAASSLFGSGNLSEGAFWETNRVNASQGNRSPTFGVMNQIQVARGQKPVSTAFWPIHAPVPNPAELETPFSLILCLTSASANARLMTCSAGSSHVITCLHLHPFHEKNLLGNGPLNVAVHLVRAGGSTAFGDDHQHRQFGIDAGTAPVF